MSFIAHPTAEVSPDAAIGAGTRLWQHCIVMKGARIGRDCKLAHNVFVESGVTVGDRVTIKDNVCLYDGLYIADDVFIGPNAVFTNVRNPRAHVSRKSAFEKTFIERGATIGANATIVCGNVIAEYAMIGAGAVVTKNVPAFALMTGSPARRIGWVSAAGEILKDDLVCPSTGERYRLAGDALVRAV
jgi:UDP-2-acetamido-3-amino-2,3-dideoxy-glucuronate N-acetyltransferase